MERGKPVWLAGAAAMAFALALPAEAYTEPDDPTDPLVQINSELDVAEQQKFALFWSGLSNGERLALAEFTSQLRLGLRGVFIGKLVQAPRDQQTGMTRYLAAQPPELRIRLARNFAQRDPGDLDRLLRAVEGFPDRGEVRIPPVISEVTNAEHALPFSAPWQAQIYKSGLSASPLSALEIRQELQQYGVTRENFERWHVCGGVLVKEGWVLTAAHCISNPRLGPFLENRRVRTGTLNLNRGGTTWRITSVVKHSGYDPGSKRNDIALVQITLDQHTDRSRNTAAKPIRMVTRRDPPLRDGEQLVVTGWGVTGETEIGSKFLDRFKRPKFPSARLMQASVPNRPLSRCNENPNFRKVHATVAPGQICAGGEGNRDACQGDSGGPLVRPRASGKATLLGLVSFGPGCGLDDTPGVYVDVRLYEKWIREAMKQARPNEILAWPVIR